VQVKNVESSEISGKTGRIYMPKQDVADMALRKMKGLKRIAPARRLQLGRGRSCRHRRGRGVPRVHPRDQWGLSAGGEGSWGV